MYNHLEDFEFLSSLFWKKKNVKMEKMLKLIFAL